MSDTDLHVWKTGNQWWVCAEYDHGPMCRNCTPVPAKVGENLSRAVRLGPKDVLVLVTKGQATQSELADMNSSLAQGLDDNRKFLVVSGDQFDVRVVPGDG